MNRRRKYLGKIPHSFEAREVYMSKFGGPIDKLGDNLCYKNDPEKAELQEQLRVTKLRLETKLQLVILGIIVACGVGALLYIYFA